MKLVVLERMEYLSCSIQPLYWKGITEKNPSIPDPSSKNPRTPGNPRVPIPLTYPTLQLSTQSNLPFHSNPKKMQKAWRLPPNTFWPNLILCQFPILELVKFTKANLSFLIFFQSLFPYGASYEHLHKPPHQTYHCHTSP